MLTAIIGVSISTFHPTIIAFSKLQDNAMQVGTDGSVPAPPLNGSDRITSSPDVKSEYPIVAQLTTDMWSSQTYTHPTTLIIELVGAGTSPCPIKY